MPSCCQERDANCGCDAPPEKARDAAFPILEQQAGGCCGNPAGAPESPHEMPGFRLWGFVEGFMQTPAGPVPRVLTAWHREDRLGAMAARLGIGRDSYRVAPGLYAVGRADDRSPVMVTANYKLSFDTLRVQLSGIDAWILVVDTRSINVWCAAGKGTFSSAEVARRVKAASLERIVAHRRLILPQLAAAGVSARQVKRLCGFEVVWGPVHAKDIGAFLDAGLKADAAMRRVTFTLRERVELIPVELNHLGKPTLYALPALFVLSGLGSGVFSIGAALSRGASALGAYILAVVAGVILAPVLLPWLPGRAFSLKGAGLGAAAGALLSVGMIGRLAGLEMLALIFFTTAVSSYLAMNFTGSTPFTSPTGVEKEMRRAIPAQAAGALIAVVLWVSAGFMAA